MSTRGINSGDRELTKQDVRSRILLKIKTQKEEDRNRKSCILKNKLFRTLAFKRAKSVMFYIAFGGEVETKEMIEETHNSGKIVAVPVCKTLRVIRPSIFHHRLVLKKGLHGVKEPKIKRFMNLKDIDLVVVPGVAFDKKGNRLGRGKGCYDYFLKSLSPQTTTIGLAFDFQILPNIPITPQDTRVNKVLFA